MAGFKVYDISPRQTTERYFLLGSFLIGAIGIIAIKLMSPWVWLSAAWAVSVLTLYLIASLLSGRVKIEPESIGDNCYYLGFLFTLTSLAITLYQLQDNDTSQAMSGIISGFGVALASTVFGVLYRVLLMQLKVDYVAREVEERAQLLAQSREFRAQLAEAAQTFKSFGVEVAQHESELLKRTSDAFDVVIEGITQKFTEKSQQIEHQFKQSLDSAAEKGAEAIVGGITHSCNTIKGEISSAAFDVSATLARLSAEQQRLLSGLTALHESSTKSAQAFGLGLTQTGVKISETQQAIRDSAASMADSLENAQLLLKETNSQIAHTADMLTQRLDAEVLDERVSRLFATLERVTKESAAAMSTVKLQLEGLDASISKVAGAIDVSGEKISEVSAALEVDADRGITVISKVDNQLSELEKSVENVKKGIDASTKEISALLHTRPISLADELQAETHNATGNVSKD